MAGGVALAVGTALPILPFYWLQYLEESSCKWLAAGIVSIPGILILLAGAAVAVLAGVNAVYRGCRMLAFQ